MHKRWTYALNSRAEKMVSVSLSGQDWLEIEIQSKRKSTKIREKKYEITLPYCLSFHLFLFFFTSMFCISVCVYYERTVT